MRRFEFDPLKNVENELKHGVGLDFAESFWESDHVVVAGRRFAHEQRYLIIAKVEEKC